MPAIIEPARQNVDNFQNLCGGEYLAAYVEIQFSIPWWFMQVTPMNARQGIWASIALTSLQLQLACAESFESLAARIPSDANALVLIDVEQTLQAPLARFQGWAAQLEAANVSRPVFLPPEAKKLVLGAMLEPANDFSPAWEVAVMELSTPVDVNAIAREESGKVDEVHGLSVANTPNDSAFVGLSANTLAAVRPSHRQFVSRWISQAQRASGPQLSEYLQSTLPLINDRAQVLLAIDLTDVLGPGEIQAKLAAAPELVPKSSDATAVAAVLTRLRGVALRLAVGNKCQARLQIDFDADVRPLQETAKPLVLHALGNLGFQTEEIDDWEVSFASNSIRMQGELSEDAQRRVFSVIELPSAKLSSKPLPPVVEEFTPDTKQPAPAAAVSSSDSGPREASLV